MYVYCRGVNDGYQARYAQDNMAVIPGLSGAGPSQSSTAPSPSHHSVDLGPGPIKRPRTSDRPDLTQPLHVDVEVKRVSPFCLSSTVTFKCFNIFHAANICDNEITVRTLQKYSNELSHKKKIF